MEQFFHNKLLILVYNFKFFVPSVGKRFIFSASGNKNKGNRASFRCVFYVPKAEKINHFPTDGELPHRWIASAWVR